MDILFKPETELEENIIQDPKWQIGADWGIPRKAHPEGKVIYHISEVLSNIDKLDISKEEREKLRLIAIIHDTFKYKIDNNQPKINDNSHSLAAREFAKKYIRDDGLLDIIEFHDEAHNSYAYGTRHKNWIEAKARAENLIAMLGDNINLYLKFYECDNRTGSKKQDEFEWFKEIVMERYCSNGEE